MHNTKHESVPGSVADLAVFSLCFAEPTSLEWDLGKTEACSSADSDAPPLLGLLVSCRVTEWLPVLLGFRQELEQKDFEHSWRSKNLAIPVNRLYLVPQGTMREHWCIWAGNGPSTVQCVELCSVQRQEALSHLLDPYHTTRIASPANEWLAARELSNWSLSSCPGRREAACQRFLHS